MDQRRVQFVRRVLAGEPVSGEERPELAAALRQGWPGLYAPAAAIMRATWPATANDALTDPLLAAILTSGPVREPNLERLLTRARRSFLAAQVTEAAVPFLLNLASQAFINEYCWAVSEEERASLAQLPQNAAGFLKRALYGPIDQIPANLPESFRPLIEEQVEAPAREREIASALPVLTPIRHGVSEVVRSMYEANPFPRWSVAGGAVMESAEALSVLIAGCGTGLDAIAARARFPNAELLAVDLSRASLAYGARKADELGVSISFAQADILELGGLGPFDVIESVGVLHHLADPVQGLRVLSSILKPGGRMRLGLYSATARAPLRAAQDLAKGYRPDVEGIRALRAACFDSPRESPLRYPLLVSDFYSTSMCRDLLMHVQEHQMTVPDLRRMLADAGLRLDGFIPRRDLPPEAPALSDLEAWEEFEVLHPATFLGMYQFFASKP